MQIFKNIYLYSDNEKAFDKKICITIFKARNKSL